MSTIRRHTRTRTRSSYAVLAGTVLALLVMPIALAGSAKAPAATANVSVEKQVKKLKRQVKKLRQQIKEVSKQPGTAGPEGRPGQDGPPGPSTGPAGGDLTGNYPNPEIGPNAIGTPEIADEAVTLDKIRPSAVGTVQIANNNVFNEDIAGDAVTNSKIAAGQVGGSEIANGAVGSSELRGASAVVGTGVLVSPGFSQEATVSCPAGSRLLGGGFEWLSEDADGSSIISSSPSFVGDPNTTWVVTGRIDTGGDGNTLFAEALCLSA